MYCTHCGKELNEDMKFCPHCGKSQEKEIAYDSAYGTVSKTGRNLKTFPKAIWGISITIAIGVVLIFLFAFQNKPSQGLEYEFRNKHYCVIGIGTCEDKKIVIPDEYNGYPVESIAYKAFEDCEKITSVHMPDTIKFVDDHAFRGCINLTNVHFSDSLEEIGDYAFYGCLKLEKINLSNSIRRIDMYAFSDCEQLKQVKIPMGCKTINNFAFSGCDNLERIDIPNSLTCMGSGCFNGCEKVEVHYDGTSYEWRAISQYSPYFSYIIDDYKVYCTNDVIN